MCSAWVRAQVSLTELMKAVGPELIRKKGRLIWLLNYTSDLWDVLCWYISRGCSSANQHPDKISRRTCSLFVLLKKRQGVFGKRVAACALTDAALGLESDLVGKLSRCHFVRWNSAFINVSWLHRLAFPKLYLNTTCRNSNSFFQSVQRVFSTSTTNPCKHNSSFTFHHFSSQLHR